MPAEQEQQHREQEIEMQFDGNRPFTERPGRDQEAAVNVACRDRRADQLLDDNSGGDDDDEQRPEPHRTGAQEAWKIDAMVAH
jgi:hypothetical protein